MVVCSSALYNGSIFPAEEFCQVVAVVYVNVAGVVGNRKRSGCPEHLGQPRFEYLGTRSGPTPSRSPSQQRSTRGWQTQNQPSLTGMPRELKPKEPAELPFDVVPSKSRSNQGGVFQMALAKANNCFQHLFTKDAAFRKQNTDFNVVSSAQKIATEYFFSGTFRARKFLRSRKCI